MRDSNSFSWFRLCFYFRLTLKFQNFNLSIFMSEMQEFVKNDKQISAFQNLKILKILSLKKMV